MLVKKATICRPLQAVTEDVLFLAEMTTLLLEDESRGVHVLESLFLRLAQEKNTYQRIEYIDMHGRKQVGVESYHGTVQPHVPQQHQNLMERYYVRGATNLKPGELYGSPLDLSVKDGQVVRPLNPMIRFAAPVRQGTQQQGIVVIHYGARDLLV